MSLKAIVLVFAVAFTTAPALAGSAEQSAFPLNAGNRWTFQDVETGSTKVVSVGRGPAATLSLRGFPGTADLRVRNVSGTIQAWDDTEGRWEPLLRLAAPAGTAYRVDLAGTTLWHAVTVTVASKSTVLRDARGKTHRGCVQLRFRYGKGLADAGLEELVFAPGVGPVRYSEQTIAGVRTRVLSGLHLEAP
jgi:hypothetical protein